MKNSNWVCFDCREVVRRPGGDLAAPANCPQCGARMGYLGDRIRVPPKRQVKAWRQLQTFVYERPVPITLVAEQIRARIVASMEQKIAGLEAQPAGAAGSKKEQKRQRDLAQLRKTLAGLGH